MIFIVDEYGTVCVIFIFRQSFKIPITNIPWIMGITWCRHTTFIQTLNFITHSPTHKNKFIQKPTIMVVTQCGGGCGGARVSHDMSWYNKIKYSLSFAWVPSQKMCFVTFEYHIYTSCWYISCSRLFFASLISYSKFWLFCTLSFVSTYSNLFWRWIIVMIYQTFFFKDKFHSFWILWKY